MLALDAAMLLLAADIAPEALDVGGFGDALLVALIASAVSTAIAVVAGVDNDEYTLMVVRRVARRTGEPKHTDVPGLLFLEIDGLALPVLRRAIRDGIDPAMARWLADGHAPAGRVGDRPLVADRREPGGHPARVERRHPGVPLGREGVRPDDDLLGPGRLRRDRAPPLDRPRPARGRRDRAAGNLLSGGADGALLTVSRLADERRANPGYRAFLANGTNVTRTLALFAWEVVARADRRGPAAPPGRPPARPPRRRLSAAARGDVRVRPRPGRVLGAAGHGARRAGGLRDVRELRRGRAPLRASSAPTRSRRCASSTSASR